MNTAPVTEDLVGIALEAVQRSGSGVGVVDEAGEHSTTLLGRRVLFGALDACGQCEVCRRGGAPVCPLARKREHGKARVRAASRWLVALADGIELPSPAAAAVAGDVALAYTMYARTGIGSREPAVITGATPVTRFLVEILLAKGVTPTVVVDRDSSFAHWMRGKGAAVVRGDDDVRAHVTAAVAAQGVGAKPWRVLATDDTAIACALAGPRSTLTVLAGSIAALPGDLLAREVTIIGVSGPHPDLVVEAAAMCVKGEIDLLGGTTLEPTDDEARAIVIRI